jgi:hypothetical protein
MELLGEHYMERTTMKLVRLQVEITQEQMDRLEHLQELAGLRTKKELIDNALTLFQWALKEKALGRAIISVDEKEETYKELEMPCLEHATHSPASRARPKSHSPNDRWQGKKTPALNSSP